MNLLMITGDRALAAGKHGAFYNTLEEFCKHFDRIDIICPNVLAKSKEQEISFFENVFVHPSPWPLIFQPLWIAYKGWQLSRTTNFKLFTCHDYPPFYNGLGAFMLWFVLRTPYVLEIMHIPGYPRTTSMRERIYKYMMRLFVRFDVMPARAVRVINRHETPEFLIRAGVPKRKITYIPAFYIDLGIFKPTNVMKEYDVIFVGRLEKNKGIDLFIDAIKEADLKAIIVGDGPLARNVKLKVKNEKLSDSITIHGWARDAREVAELMNKSKVLVTTSYNEGGPRVVLEALACGMPVVATRVGIVPDVVPFELQCDWNAADIAAKCKRLIDDEALYQRLREQGLKIVRQFERTASVTAYADALKSFITP